MPRISNPRTLPSLFALAFVLPLAACSQESGETRNTAATPTAAASQPTPVQTPTPVRVEGAGKVNVNTTPEKDFLTAVPNLGDRMAHEFEEYKPYRSIQQFRKEIGKYVKPEQVAEYEKYIYVPIAINESDAATLQQLPGVDASAATELIKGRPYASPDAFFAKLGGYVSQEELAVGRTYVAER